MTFLQLYTEIALTRFNSSTSKIGQIKNWINAREADVWRYADWPLKSADVAVTVTGGQVSVPLGGNFFRWPDQGLQLLDDLGDELSYLDPETFFRLYQPLVASGARYKPEAWTVDTAVSGSVATPQLHLGPTPQSGYTFRLRGWTLPIKRTAADTWALGFMSGDTDLPWWPDHEHYPLVDGAIAYGKRLEGDPSWRDDEARFKDWLQNLAWELLPQRGTEIWGEAC